MHHPASLRYVRVLSIAGSDSGGGAGIQADLKTIAALGAYGLTALTALTAQNTLGVQAIHPLPPSFLRAQLCSVFDDIGVDAIKIGMLHTPEMVEVVAWAIDQYRPAHVVLDPVMVATSGDRLINAETETELVRQLFPRASLITPNLDEAQCLLQRPIEHAEQLPQAATDLLQLGARAVLLKGGHLKGDTLVDCLLLPGTPCWSLSSERIKTLNVHGTGCTLSSAIATHLALGLPLFDAVQKSRAYIHAAIAAASLFRLGQGHGPLNHGYAPIATRTVPVGGLL